MITPTEPQPAIYLQDDFQNFLDEFEISYRDYNLAEATWIKAEEAMLNSSKQKNAVIQLELKVDTTEAKEHIEELKDEIQGLQIKTSMLGKVMKNQRSKNKLPHPTLPDRTADGFLVNVKEPKELTQAELQFLTSVLKDEISVEQRIVRSYKENSRRLWDKCDKKNVETSWLFSRLKDSLNMTDSSKKRLQSLVNIQKKLKYLRDN